MRSPTRSGAPHQSDSFHDRISRSPHWRSDDVGDGGRHGRGQRAQGVAVEVDDAVGEAEEAAPRRVASAWVSASSRRGAGREVSRMARAIAPETRPPGGTTGIAWQARECTHVSIGVLAVQGDVREHLRVLESLRARAALTGAPPAASSTTSTAS